MEISPLVRNEEFSGLPIEVPISLQNRSVSSGSESTGSDQRTPDQNRRGSTGSRRDSTSSQNGKKIRRNSKSEATKKTAVGASVSSNGSGPGSLTKVAPVTAFKAAVPCRKGFGDRKSKAAQGRGLPKKQGGGGSFTWGKPGCELSDANKSLNGTDRPNYDPLEDPEVIFDSLDIEPSTEEIFSSLDSIIGEYFNNASLEDFLDSVEGLMVRRERNRILEKLIENSLEHKNEYRELASKAIKFCREQNYWNEIEVARAFCSLLDRLEELILDTPDAPLVVGKFVARADWDGCLPDNFLEEERYGASDTLTLKCLDQAYAVIKDSHSVATCWGTVIGGFTDTNTLTEKIRELLKEFVSSGDKEEAVRCLKDLDVPHYHHELVYEAILISMEAEDDRVINSMTWLLHYMSKEGVVSVDQMQSGFCRFYADVDDIMLDIPHVHAQLEKMVSRVAQRNLISNKVRLQCPNRSRKRFSSESDAGMYRNEIDIRGSMERPRLSSVGVHSGLDSLPEDAQIE